MTDLVEIPEIVYDERARDGTWCQSPYWLHPKGCPNFPKCVKKSSRFGIEALKELENNGFKFYAVIEEFDLKNHAEKMKLKHPDWSEHQCRCVLYWQNGVRDRLLRKTLKYRLQLYPFVFELDKITVLLDIPEASGINVFATLQKAGVVLERTKPSIVKKVMFIGILSTHAKKGVSALGAVASPETPEELNQK